MLKRTTDEVAIYFEEQGCKLIDEYKGALLKMKYICSCGQQGCTSWNNFTKGKRCGNCAKHGLCKKRTLEQVKQIFLERNCQFLDDEFNGIHFSHNYKCKCGAISKISFSGFYHQNQYCKQCGLNKMRGSNNPVWRTDRDQLKLEQQFRKKCYKALRSSLKSTGKEKIGRTSEMLGYTPKELQEHIMSHPNWNDVKDGNWHIDHIFPIKAFIDYDINDISLINCLDNLRPILQKDNNIKWANYESKNFEEWLFKKGAYKH